MGAPQAALQLEAYFIDNLSMKTNALFDPSVQSYQGDISVEPRHLVRKNSEDVHQLVLRIKYVPRQGAETCLPYSIDITGRGFFSFSDPELTSERRFEMLAFNGTSILFGLLRAEVAHSTALGAWGSMLLPTVNLAQCLADWAKRQSSKGTRPRRPSKKMDATSDRDAVPAKSEA